MVEGPEQRVSPSARTSPWQTSSRVCIGYHLPPSIGFYVENAPWCQAKTHGIGVITEVRAVITRALGHIRGIFYFRLVTCQDLSCWLQIHDSGLSCSVDWRESGQKMRHSIGLQGIFELVVAGSNPIARAMSPPAQNQSVEYVDYLGRSFSDLSNHVSDARDYAPSTPQQSHTPRSDQHERSVSSSTKRSILKTSRLELSSLDSSTIQKTIPQPDQVEDASRIFAPFQPSPVPFPSPRPLSARNDGSSSIVIPRDTAQRPHASAHNSTVPWQAGAAGQGAGAGGPPPHESPGRGLAWSASSLPDFRGVAPCVP